MSENEPLELFGLAARLALYLLKVTSTWDFTTLLFDVLHDIHGYPGLGQPVSEKIFTGLVSNSA